MKTTTIYRVNKKKNFVCAVVLYYYVKRRRRREEAYRLMIWMEGRPLQEVLPRNRNAV
jgi:hypothetical protein